MSCNFSSSTRSVLKLTLAGLSNTHIPVHMLTIHVSKSSSAICCIQYHKLTTVFAFTFSSLITADIAAAHGFQQLPLCTQFLQYVFNTSYTVISRYLRICFKFAKSFHYSFVCIVLYCLINLTKQLCVKSGECFHPCVIFFRNPHTGSNIGYIPSVTPLIKTKFDFSSSWSSERLAITAYLFKVAKRPSILLVRNSYVKIKFMENKNKEIY